VSSSRTTRWKPSASRFARGPSRPERARRRRDAGRARGGRRGDRIDPRAGGDHRRRERAHARTGRGRLARGPPDDDRRPARASGADIGEINAVRKHLSALKGGRLARRAPATVASVVLSDVVGNDLSVIASGPVAPDASTFDEALAVLEQYGIDAPEAVAKHLERGAAGKPAETPGPDAPVFETVSNHVVADGMTVLEAARDAAAERGYEPLVLSSRVRGEARDAATTHVAIAEEVWATGTPVSPPAVLLSGGETTVTVRGDGTGGPNQEFATSAALELEEGGGDEDGSGDEEGGGDEGDGSDETGSSGEITVAAVDTDGIDGATDAAGALVDGTTVEDTTAARETLAENDVYPYLESRNGLILTGPTGTNLNDLRVLVVGYSSHCKSLHT